MSGFNKGKLIQVHKAAVITGEVYRFVKAPSCLIELREKC